MSRVFSSSWAHPLIHTSGEPQMKPRKKAKTKLKSRVYQRWESYVRRDKKKGLSNGNLSLEDVIELTSHPCFYCGTTKMERGLDRIDNSLGHAVDNGVSACPPCHALRRFFSIQEMIDVVGPRMGRIHKLVDPKRPDSEVPRRSHKTRHHPIRFLSPRS